MIEKFEKEGLYYKTINLKDFNSADVVYQYAFVLERIINPETEFSPEEVEVRETLFAFAKARNEFRRGDLYRIICDIYDKLSNNYLGWVYDETLDETQESGAGSGN